MSSRHHALRSSGRLIVFVLGCLMLVGLFLVQLERTRQRAPGAARDQAICHGGKLGTPAAREQAMEQGYAINQRLDCIARASYEAVQAQRSQAAVARQQSDLAQALAEQRRAAQAAADASRTLAEARRGFKTAVAVTDLRREPLPTPPGNLYVRSDYESAGRNLAAFVSPSPRDGRRTPAIIWLTGGDTNTLGQFWVPGPAGRDESAQAFRQAGLVMMFPTLRGGNTNPGAKELGMGEVADVLAAADHLASLPYVDPAQIYLGGHSTGGTLALLVAQLSTRFAAVLAFGPVADVRDYGPSFGNGMQWSGLLNAQDEVQLRSPGPWMRSIRSPTYVIEGKQAPSNLRSVADLCERAAAVAAVHCLQVPGHDHFSVLAPVIKVAAMQMLVAGPEHFQLHLDQFKLPEAPPAQEPGR